MKPKVATLSSQPQYAGSPFMSPLVTLLLMMICIMLAMVSANLQIYHYQQKETEKRLSAQINFITNTKPSNTPIQIIDDALIFSPQPHLPQNIKQRLNDQSPILLPTTLAHSLGWNRFNNPILVQIIPNMKPTMVMVMEIPKHRLTKSLAYVGLYLSLAILAIMLTYTFLSRMRVRRRIHYISDTANAIVEGKLDKRIPINPAIVDEYSHLSQTLNAMLDKNAQLMQDLRQVNNNIAHDLKSPLNRMRSRMEVALMNSRDSEDYQNALSLSIDDVDNLLKTFQALLLMGNLDSNARNYELKPTSLSTILDNLTELYEMVAEDNEHRFECKIARDIDVFANQSLLTQAISNVLENAIKYTPKGGHIQCFLQRQGSTALIIIADNGSGIPVSERQTVFERFTRLDRSRQLPGTGLGMSLVQSILKVHNASIQLHDNEPGLRIEIRLRCG